MEPKDKQVEQRLADLEKQIDLVRTSMAGVPGTATLDAITLDVGLLTDEKKRRTRDADVRLNRITNPLANGNGHVVPKTLQISSRLSRPDDLARHALRETTKLYTKGAEAATQFIQDNGLGTAMTRLSASLNGSGALDETNRLLLAEPDIYGSLVLSLLKGIGTGDRAKLDKFVTDRDGFRIAVLAALEANEGPRHTFMRALASESLKRSGATLDEKKGIIGKRLIAELRANPVPLGTGRVEGAIETVHERIIGEGVYPTLVDDYAATKEVDASRFTPAIRQAMVRHLIARGVSIDLNNPDQVRRFTEGGYDEYFAVAYEQAVSASTGDDDPIVATSVKGATMAPWDFTVDSFESIEEQGVVRDNILAAGALDYIYELGERLGVFRLVDALTLNWAAGSIDVVDGPCAAKLYRYWKLRDQRSDPSERGLVYKRVLNKGETEALDRMVVNENFADLWGTMAEKVAEYRAKVEDAKVEQGDNLLVSRTPIYQAVRDLQYNLTEFCTGMAHMQVREMYSQLREAMELLGDPEIVDHFAGGRRKTMWTAIERLSKSEYGEAPNINAIRIAAVEGNAVFRFIANFQQGSVVEEEFQRFIEAAEAWIIAKGSDDSSVSSIDDDDDDSEDDDQSDDFGDEEV
jgi:hypothetical protein